MAKYLPTLVMGVIFIIVNGQILKKPFVHLVTLDETGHWELDLETRAIHGKHFHEKTELLGFVSRYFICSALNFNLR